MSVRFERMTIAGVGLIGGSLALAARHAGLVGEVVGFGRSRENLALALARGIVDRVADAAAGAAAGADLVVLATPVATCGPLARALGPHARRGAILTDVGSVKAEVVTALEAAWSDVGPVVGGHPIAGSEAWGAGAAQADLFAGRRCILTPTPASDAAAVARVRALWEGVGARVEVMSPAVHDELLARVSHLPHVVAYALVAALGDAEVDGRRILDYAGSGFRDTTRIAASRAELWRDIVLANATAIGAALADFRRVVDELATAIAAGDGAALERTFTRAERLRRSLAEASG